jgi:hypothetical protein
MEQTLAQEFGHSRFVFDHQDSQGRFLPMVSRQPENLL